MKNNQTVLKITNVLSIEVKVKLIFCIFCTATLLMLGYGDDFSPFTLAY